VAPPLRPDHQSSSLHPRIAMGAADPDYALRCLAERGGARCLCGKDPGQMVEDHASRQIPWKAVLFLSL